MSSYLLADTPPLSSEDGIPAQQARKEAVVTALLCRACGVNVSEDNHGRFVNDCESRKIARMLACCFQDELELFPESVSRFKLARRKSRIWNKLV